MCFGNAQLEDQGAPRGAANFSRHIPSGLTPAAPPKVLLAPQGTTTTRHREQEGWVSMNSQDCISKDVDPAFVHKGLCQVTSFLHISALQPGKHFFFLSMSQVFQSPSAGSGVSRKGDIPAPAWGQICHLSWLELFPGGQEEKLGLQLAQRDALGSTELPQ